MQHLKEHAQKGRRDFLKQIAATIGGLVVWPAVSGPAVAEVFAALAQEKYPTPRYLPNGYRLSAQYIDRPDGFGGGSTELALWYVNPKHPQGFNNPLSIYIVPRPQHSSIGATEGRHGTSMILTMVSGAIVSADYHDGFWMPSPDGLGQLVWNTDNVHSLTFKLHSFTVGVRGSRLVGISREELVRIASSLG